MQVPFLLLGVHAGIAADRMDRRQIMLWSDVISAVLMIGLLALTIIVASPSGWILLLVGFLLSSISAFFDPARNAAVPSLVPSDQLIEANGLSATTRTLMQLIGPLLTTILLPILETAGPRWFFPLAILLNLVTFAYSAYCIYRLPPIRPDSSQHVRHDSMFKEFGEGLRFIWQIPLLKIALFLTAFINLVVAPILLGYINANRLWFNESPRTFAGMQAAFFLGMVISGLVVMKIKIKHPGQSYAGGLLVMGISVAYLAFAQNYWLFFLLSLLAGISMPFTVIPLTTYLQIVVPDHLRGRVNSSLNMLTNLLLPIGWLVAGLTIDQLGVSRLFLGMGIIIVLVGLAGYANRIFREATMPAGSDDPVRQIA